VAGILSLGLVLGGLTWLWRAWSMGNPTAIDSDASPDRPSLWQRFSRWLPFGIFGGALIMLGSLGLGLAANVRLESVDGDGKIVGSALASGAIGIGIFMILFGLGGRSLRQVNRMVG
jgi:hypothetical protein